MNKLLSGLVLIIGMFSGQIMAAGLVETLVSQLGVNQEQASGGAAALLGYAQNELAESDWTQLTEYIPEATGLAESSDLGGGFINTVIGLFGGSPSLSMANVVEAFTGMGLDPGLITQFTPVILDYLKQQGGDALVGKLIALWQP